MWVFATELVGLRHVSTVGLQNVVCNAMVALTGHPPESLLPDCADYSGESALEKLVAVQNSLAEKIDRLEKEKEELYKSTVSKQEWNRAQARQFRV